MNKHESALVTNPFHISSPRLHVKLVLFVPQINTSIRKNVFYCETVIWNNLSPALFKVNVLSNYLKDCIVNFVVVLHFSCCCIC